MLRRKCIAIVLAAGITIGSIIGLVTSPANAVDYPKGYRAYTVYVDPEYEAKFSVTSWNYMNNIGQVKRRYHYTCNSSVDQRPLLPDDYYNVSYLMHNGRIMTSLSGYMDRNPYEINAFECRWRVYRGIQYYKTILRYTWQP